MVIHFFEEVALNGDQSKYRSIIFRKPLLFTISSNNLSGSLNKYILQLNIYIPYFLICIVSALE